MDYKNDLIDINNLSTTIKLDDSDTVSNLPAEIALKKNNKRLGEGGRRLKGFYKHSELCRPLITVITVVLNGEAYIEQTIKSVINQTYDNVEYIIIDGGSSDSTVDIINKYNNQIDYWVSEKDNGIYEAWNKGVSLASGDWISFIGSDDEYLSSALEEYVGFILTLDEEVYYVSSRVNLVSNDTVVREIGMKWDCESAKKYMVVAHVGSLHSKALFQNIGLFNSNLKVVGDYELLLRAGYKLKPGYFKKVTAKMRVGGVSDDGLKSLLEAAQVKLLHTGRKRIVVYFEFIIAYIKWRIRNTLWY